MLRAGEPVPSVELVPAFGRAISLPGDLSLGPIALVCLGGLSTPDTRAAVDALQLVSADLDRLGVRLVALTTTALERVQSFVSRYHVLFPVVADPTCALRTAFAVEQGGASNALRGLAREITRPGRSLRTGRGWVEPSAFSPAACFVLDPGGTVTWSLEGVPFPAMVAAAEISSRG